MKIKHSLNNGHKESRRSFLKKAGTAAISIAGAEYIIPPVMESAEQDNNNNASPWYRRVTRWGQTNITETDPATYDIQWWRSYWKKTNIQGVVVNAGGIVAYYPSKVPLHKQAELLGGRDLFGELCRTAQKDGLAVFARMDSNRAHEEFYRAHPDWFTIDASGKPYKAGDLYITCINSPYYEEHIPSILREIIGLYHPEGFTDNSWSGLGRNSICYCGNCRTRFLKWSNKELPVTTDWDDPAYRDWIKWNYNRRIEIWDLNNSVTRTTGGKDCIWAGMNSSSVSGQGASFRDYKEICERAEIIMLDSQARSDAEGFQQNSISGRLIHGLLGWDKLIPESMAMYQMGRPIFRLSSKPVQEARMWMIEGFAGGIQPWWHHVGAYHEDRRMYRTAAPVFEWHKLNTSHMVNRLPVATVGIVWSQMNTDFFGRTAADNLTELPWRGITQALTRARIPFLPVHADNIERDSGRFSQLILPNIGALSDSQVSSIHSFVKKGGNLFATGLTSLFNDQGEPRSDFALADLFGTHISGKVSPLSDGTAVKRARDTYHTYVRLDPELRRRVEGPHRDTEPQISGDRHPVLKGFDETDILSFGGILEPLRTDQGTKTLMTFIPEFPVFPPETAWMKVPKTDIPGLIINELAGGNRIVFMPADFDRQFGRYNLPDHGNLIANIIRWTSRDDIPLVVEGPGLIDCNLYIQNDHFVLHIVNLTSAGTWRQPVDEYIPLGPFKIGVKLRQGIKGQNVVCLVSGKKQNAEVRNGWSWFDINRITDHEVVVLT